MYDLEDDALIESYAAAEPVQEERRHQHNNRNRRFNDRRHNQHRHRHFNNDRRNENRSHAGGAPATEKKPWWKRLLQG
jgi:hypothetical protein